jgi:hypothetical protein
MYSTMVGTHADGVRVAGSAFGHSSDDAGASAARPPFGIGRTLTIHEASGDAPADGDSGLGRATSAASDTASTGSASSSASSTSGGPRALTHKARSLLRMADKKRSSAMCSRR